MIDVKLSIKSMIQAAAQAAYDKGKLPSAAFPLIELDEPKIEAHGDMATNAAMIMASSQRMAPRKIADILLAHMDDPEGIIAKTEVAGPGFINFFINPSAWLRIVKYIHEKDEAYGSSEIGKNTKVQVEFVSANPTGPLHVGHGRGAAVGDAVAAVLSFCGYDVQREYYINDSGRQIQTLGLSVFMRYKELLGEPVSFPKDCYQGDYIRELAAVIREDKGDELLKQDEAGARDYCARFAANSILSGIREDLDAFGVWFDNWYSEQSLYDSGKVDGAIKYFQDQGMIYKSEEALWFKTSQYGDEKDRVIVRGSGQTTYFASDIAYHRDKFDRGLEWVIDVWGADHHGYIPRMTAAVEACGRKREQFRVILVQLVNLLRGGTPVAMSSRAGEFVTLKAVIDEVGKDAARFIFLTRHYESKLDFDLEVARQKNNDNPVYYVQYVHARISSVMAKAAEQGIGNILPDDEILSRLQEPEEIQLMKIMGRYPDVVETAARMLEPHRIPYYLEQLSSAFHTYYNKHRVLTDDLALSRGRLCMIQAVQKVIRNGLNLLGVSAPDKM
jgi:arginyl-tRNA synthetase